MNLECCGSICPAWEWLHVRLQDVFTQGHSDLVRSSSSHAVSGCDHVPIVDQTPSTSACPYPDISLPRKGTEPSLVTPDNSPLGDRTADRGYSAPGVIDDGSPVTVRMGEIIKEFISRRLGPSSVRCVETARSGEKETLVRAPGGGEVLITD